MTQTTCPFKSPRDAAAAILAPFKKGDRVRYIPPHANGDFHHPDCEDGVVKRVSDLVPSDPLVFVIYDNAMCVMTTGDEPYTPQGTPPADLVHLGVQK